MSWLFGDTSKMTGSFPADVRNWGSSNVKKFEEFRAYVATVDKRCAGWLTDDMMVSSIPAHNSNAKRSKLVDLVRLLGGDTFRVHYAVLQSADKICALINLCVLDKATLWVLLGYTHKCHEVFMQTGWLDTKHGLIDAQHMDYAKAYLYMELADALVEVAPKRFEKFELLRDLLSISPTHRPFGELLDEMAALGNRA